VLNDTCDPNTGHRGERGCALMLSFICIAYDEDDRLITAETFQSGDALQATRTAAKIVKRIPCACGYEMWNGAQLIRRYLSKKPLWAEHT